MHKKIVIIGAGLSGILTAYRLSKKGYAIEIIEARDRIGGRIHSIKSGEVIVEMGATWFNPTHKNLIALLHEFEIDFFEQFMKGKSFFEASLNASLQTLDLSENGSSYRITGGTINLIEKIKSQLNDVKIHLNEEVIALDFTQNNVLITTNKQAISADYVISTMPQPLFIDTLISKPSLPEQLISISKKTHTWMQDSIKIALVYATPFWRDKGKSGAFFSNIGPIVEFYDHATNDLTGFALCGFAQGELALISKQERKAKILKQLENVFGKEVLDFIAYHEVIWSQETFTENNNQEGFLYPHQNNGHPLFRESQFENRLFLSGTETASQFPGYMEGAIIASNYTVNAILNKQ
jgi:monoamine oxidase